VLVYFNIKKIIKSKIWHTAFVWVRTCSKPVGTIKDVANVGFSVVYVLKEKKARDIMIYTVTS
jgi:hypothetical protein